MRRYGRLWRRFATLALAREMEYRVNFALGLVEAAAQAALAVVTMLVVYRFADTLGGWTQAQVLLLVGVYRAVDGLINLQVAPNMQSIAGYIRRGDLDFLLLRPVSSQFLVSFRYLAPTEAVNVAIGLGIVVVAGKAAGVRWSVGGVAEALAFAACGLAVLYALWFCIVTLSFWLVDVGNLDRLFYGIFEAARYPVGFFRGAMRALLTFVVPIAFATTFPAQAVLGTADLRLLLYGAAAAASALALAHLLWRHAIRSYSSASS